MPAQRPALYAKPPAMPILFPRCLRMLQMSCMHKASTRRAGWRAGRQARSVAIRRRNSAETWPDWCQMQISSAHIAPLAEHDASCIARGAANTERAMMDLNALRLSVMRDRTAPDQPMLGCMQSRKVSCGAMRSGKRRAEYGAGDGNRITPRQPIDFPSLSRSGVIQK